MHQSLHDGTYSPCPRCALLRLFQLSQLASVVNVNPAIALFHLTFSSIGPLPTVSGETSPWTTSAATLRYEIAFLPTRATQLIQ